MDKRCINNHYHCIEKYGIFVWYLITKRAIAKDILWIILEYTDLPNSAFHAIFNIHCLYNFPGFVDTHGKVYRINPESSSFSATKPIHSIAANQRCTTKTANIIISSFTPATCHHTIAMDQEEQFIHRSIVRTPHKYSSFNSARKHSTRHKCTGTRQQVSDKFQHQCQWINLSDDDDSDEQEQSDDDWREVQTFCNCSYNQMDCRRCFYPNEYNSNTFYFY